MMAPVRCAVPDCKETGGFKFPSDKYLNTQWRIAIRRGIGGKGKSLWKPNEYSVVCHKHFKEEDFRIPVQSIAAVGGRARKNLKHGVVPTIFDDREEEPKPIRVGGSSTAVRIKEKIPKSRPRGRPRKNSKTPKPGDHQSARYFQCQRCEYVTNQKIVLQQHVKAVHDKIKDFKCDSCEYASSYKNALLQHVESIHNPTRQLQCRCQWCGKWFYKENLLQQHVKAVHDNLKDLKCDKCEFVTAHSSSLGRHIKEIHLNIKQKKKPTKPIGPKTCDQCAYLTNCNRALKRHKDAMHGNVKHFSCDICQDFYSLYQAQVDQHKMSFHEKKLDFKCSHCPFVASDKHGLDDHSLNHVSQVMDDRCEECDLAFLCKESLEAHIIEVHDKALLKDRKILRRQTWRSQMRSSTKPTCDKCPYLTNCWRALKRHKDAMHGDVKHYSCDICQDFYSLYQAEVDQHKMSFHEKTAGERFPLNNENMSALEGTDASYSNVDDGVDFSNAIKVEPLDINHDEGMEFVKEEALDVNGDDGMEFVKEEPIEYEEVAVKVEIVEDDYPITT